MVAPFGKALGGVELFDSAGKRVRTLVSAAKSPFQWIAFIRFARDGTPLIFDLETNKLYRIDTSGAVIGRIPLKGEVADVITFPERLVVNARIQTRAEIGVPLHIFDDKGTVIRSFGDEVGKPTVPGTAVEGRRVLAHAGENAFWAGKWNEYKVDLWSLEGKLLRTIRSKPDWFVPWFKDPSADADVERPVTRLKAVYQDPAGLLWMMFQLPDAAWKPRSTKPSRRPAPDTARQHIDEELIPIPMLDRLYDSLIEVVDPRTGQMVISQRFDEILGPFVSDGNVARLVEDAAGRRSIEIWQLSLTR